MKIFIRIAVNAIALYVAVALLQNGIHPQSTNWLSFVWLALIFGVINAFVRPILVTLGCPFILLSLGLGLLVINTLLFMLAGTIGTAFGVGFTVDSWFVGFLGSLIVSVVSFLLNLLLGTES